MVLVIITNEEKYSDGIYKNGFWNGVNKWILQG